jgi:hypothetical protein
MMHVEQNFNFDIYRPLPTIRCTVPLLLVAVTFDSVAALKDYINYIKH